MKPLFPVQWMVCVITFLCHPKLAFSCASSPLRRRIFLPDQIRRTRCNLYESLVAYSSDLFRGGGVLYRDVRGALGRIKTTSICGVETDCNYGGTVL
jgi:hypothetical protein